GSFGKPRVVAAAAVIEPAGRLRTICHILPGQWLVEGIGFYAGLALRWLRDIAVRQPRHGRAPGEPGAYAALDRLAIMVPPGSGGLLAESARPDAWTLAPSPPPFPPPPAPPPPPPLPP